MTWLFIAIPVVAALVWVFNGIRLIGKVSRGERIGERPNRALLLIDLQTVFWDGGAYNEEARAKAESAILAEISAARASGVPIIAVRQEWSIPSTRLIARVMMKGQAIARTPGTELADPFKGAADHNMVKRVQDAFETGELDQLLQRLDVGRIRIAGLDASYCVAKTALAGRARGYKVELAAPAILAADESSRRRAFRQLEDSGVVIQ
ncbi:cysteine hydrolase family protein [Roseibium sp.]|uniref:cysteine hydrolase family protein n=1 Tax=Roseibium sp. TaxID=1936156 RepID=UPI003A970D3E